MPKPNYSFAKRQRELEKERKKAEKARKKAAGPQPEAETQNGETPEVTNAPAVAPVQE
jgi:hypothetical protein